MTPHKHSRRVARVSALVVTLLAVSGALAQTKPPHSSTPAAPAAPAPPPGLDGFNDQAMVSTLYLRGAESLADRIVKTKNLDPAVVNALRFPVLVKQLDAKIPTAQKEELVKQIVAALPLALPNMNDHNFIMRTALALKENGLARGLELHEYWGEDQNDQKAAMLPVANATVQLVSRAIDVVAAKQNALLQGVPVNGGANDPRLAEWNRLDAIAETYKYNKPFFEYILAVAMDAKDQKRSDLCDAAIAELDQYIQAGDLTAKNETGKLQLTKLDFDPARTTFKEVITAADAQIANKAQMQPDEFATLLLNKDLAVYFLAVTEVLDKKLQPATQAYQALLDWNKASATWRKKEDIAALDAAARMLQFRIALLDASNAANDSDRQVKVAAANKILLDLVTAFPQFRPTILDRLKNNLPPNPNVATLDPLMLEAMVQGGSDVLAKNVPDGMLQPADYTALKHAASAAEQLLITPGLSTPDQAKYLYLAGVFWDKADEDMKAIIDYLKYMKQYPAKGGTDLEKRRYDVALAGAVDSAGHWMKVSSSGATDPQDYERYKICVGLAAEEGLSVPTYSPYIYLYGKILIANENPPRAKDAIEWLKHVPATDTNYSSSLFWQMMCNKQLSIMASEQKNEADKKKYSEAVIQLAPEVAKGFEAQADKAADAKDKLRFHRMSAQTDVEAADLAQRVLHDPATALNFLEGIEDKLQDDPAAASLLEDAVKTKIVALLDAKENDKAVTLLKKLLQKDPKKAFDQVGAVVFKLGNDYKALETRKADADKRGDQDASNQALDEMRRVNSQLKDLTDMAMSKDVMPADMSAKDQAQWQQFRLVVSQREANLEPDPEKKKADLRDVVAAFDKLIAQNPDSLLLKVKQADVNFDLGDYAKAQPVFVKLFSKSMYGQPTIITEDTGKTEPNERYWDLAYKLWKCNAEMAKADPSKKQDLLDPTVKNMKMHYVRFGPELAGTSSRPLIDELRKEIAPDFDPAKYSTSGTTPPATTAPAASAK